LALFFFFQAEDGIRDFHVTGVQTCALPIFEPDSMLAEVVAREGVRLAVLAVPGAVAQEVTDRLVGAGVTGLLSLVPAVLAVPDRSEERRVGKECRWRGWAGRVRSRSAIAWW